MRNLSIDLPRLRRVLPILLFTCAYVVCAYLSLSLLQGSNVAVSFWPASGVSLGAFMMMRWRAWPVPLLGEFLSGLIFPEISLPVSLMTGIANLTETASAYWILQRLGVHPQLRRVNHTAYLIIAIITGATLGAWVATFSQVLGGTVGWDSFLHQWYRWWLGDALGMMIVAPFIAAWGTLRTGENTQHHAHRSALGLAALFFSCVLISMAAFMPEQLGMDTSDAGTRWVFPFHVIPFLILMALYSRLRDITALQLTIAIIAMTGTVAGSNAFPSAANPIDMVALFLFVSTWISLMVHARSAEWSNAMTALEKEQGQRLSREIGQRETLVREVHHRIKNNLQGVTGILRRHAERQPHLADPINTAISQVKSIAILYGLKSNDPTASMRLAGIIRLIAADINTLWHRHIAIDIPPACASCTIQETEAVPIGLILNELLLNAVKHGSGFDHIKISLRQSKEHNAVRVIIQNPGVFLPHQTPDHRAAISSGLELVESLMPRKGAVLSWEQHDHLVVTTLELAPPVIDCAFTTIENTDASPPFTSSGR